MLVKLSAESEELVDLNRDCHVVVRDVLLREGQAVSNNLANLTVLEIFESTCWKVTWRGCLLLGTGSGDLGLRSSFEFLDVGGDDSIIWSSADDLGQIQSFLFGKLLGVWAHEHPTSIAGA